MSTPSGADPGDLGALQRREARLRAVLDALHDGVLVLRVDGSVERLNHEAALWLADAAEAVQAAGPGWMAQLETRPVEPGGPSPQELVASVLAGDWLADVHVLARAPSGELRTLRLGGRPLPASVGGGAVLTVRDVTQTIVEEEALRRDARRDVLTDLANRRAFDEALVGAGDADVVVVVDLERFKPVNDRLGHHAGDIVLVTIGARLRAHVRGGDVAARVGGDEFGLLLRRISDDRVPRLLERLRELLEVPMTVEGHSVSVGASVGSARCRRGESAAEVLRRADAAMYQDKRHRQR